MAADELSMLTSHVCLYIKAVKTKKGPPVPSHSGTVSSKNMVLIDGIHTDGIIKMQ